MEQLVLSKQARFGRSTEKMGAGGQIYFLETDGTIVFFNEAEAVADLEPVEEEIPSTRKKKSLNVTESVLTVRTWHTG